MARIYQGAGGMRLLLDEPLSDEMAKQVARGHLVPVVDEVLEAEPYPSSTPTPADPDAPVEKPTANSRVDDWRAYAVSLGMPEEDAAGATKKDCQEYVQVVEDANDGPQV
ncbi:hypothetical protein ACIQNU_04415 [Streptomyces sp. NPDC091292]|uniref:hypothetical protein n=1 Tax=Streptomyces sp. NPDC091292 TaxID=3365991 RepID=UPI003830D242